MSVLHRGTIAKTLLGAIFLYEACGRHARLVAPRHGIEDQRSADPASWRLVPHAVIVYRLFPNAVLLSQGSHVELYRFFPDPERPDTTVCRLSFASPAGDTSARDWDEMLRLALGVLDREDFALMEGRAGQPRRWRPARDRVRPERDRPAEFPPDARRCPGGQVETTRDGVVEPLHEVGGQRRNALVTLQPGHRASENPELTVLSGWRLSF